MNRLSIVLVLLAALAACSEPTTTALNQLNLDRPVDVAFACYGQTVLAGNNETTVGAQPTVACELQSPQLDKSLPQIRDNLARGWYGFILESAPGTVAVAQWPSKAADKFGAGDFTVLDADPLTPGKNAISVGEEPIAIATDTAGCFEVTANAGSCDLSTLEIASAVDGNPATPVVVKRVQVKNAAGVPIRARPAAMVAQPSSTAVNNACTASATGLVYVAYPSCHLVAAVDMATERVVAGIQFAADGTATITDGNVTCRDQCPNDQNMLGGGPVTAGARPVTLDLRYKTDPRYKIILVDDPDDESNPPKLLTKVDGIIAGTAPRLAIGADDSALVTVVDLDPTTLRPVAAAPLQVPLQGAGLGVTTVALSPQITMGGTTKNNDGSTEEAIVEGQYVYAVATDNTVRVADVLTVNKECDTQVDPRLVRAVNVRARLQCFPVGDPTTPARRPTAISPGISIPGSGVPTSVAIIRGLDEQLTSVDGNGVEQTIAADATTLIGHFAMISSSTGTTYVVNIDNDFGPDAFLASDPFTTAPTLVMAHQLRDNLNSRGTRTGETATCDVQNPDITQGGALAGAPRITAPLSNVTLGGVPTPVAGEKARELPSLRQVKCVVENDMLLDKDRKPVAELQFTADDASRAIAYPDLGAVRPETWLMTYEGSLSQDAPNGAVDGPIVRSSLARVDATSLHLIDNAKQFCAAGVEPFDVIQMRGCNPSNGNLDCPAGYDCFLHPQSQLPLGSCILHSEAERLATACRDFLVSLKHYTVGPVGAGAADPKSIKAGELVLLPRKRVLRTTPLDGCTSSPQCETLADYALETASSSDPVNDQTPADPRTWECLTDDARPPVNADPLLNKRCIMTCGFHSRDVDGLERDADCDVNTICEGATPTKRGICMEGVLPPQSCINGPQRFEIHASEAFTLIGTASGYLHPNIDLGDRCGRDPAASPFLTARLPLKAPACDPNVDPITGRNPTTGVAEPNPCSTTVAQADEPRIYPDIASRSCVQGMPDTASVQRTAPGIRLRTPSMTLTMVDPYYPGDATCILDRQGTLDRVPLVFPGYQMVFTQAGAFSGQTLSAVAPTYPIKIVRGPGNSIWVVDDGDFLSQSILRPSTRGGVFRVDPVNFSLYTLLQ